MVKGKKLAALLAPDARGPRSATPANERLGMELFEAGAVEIIERDDARVLARVNGGTRRTVEFAADNGALSWKCTCKKGQERFCKHAVALSLSLSLGEKTRGAAAVGLTKGAGWELGARRTYDIGTKDAWAFVVSARFIQLLTGRNAPLEGDGPLSSWEGPPVAYEVTTFVPGSHFRMRWREIGWSADSTLQLRVIPAPRGRTAIAFHQERLADSRVREIMLRRWDELLGEIAEIIDAKRKGEKA